MNRKPVVVFLLLVVFALVLGGCQKSATGDVPVVPMDVDVDGEGQNMMVDAAANTTPVPISETPVATAPPVATEEPTTVVVLEPVTEEPTESPTPVLVIETPVAAQTPVPVISTPETTTTPGTHIVQPGENLFRIALRYNTTVEALSQLNGITNPALIRVGQQLRVSGTPGTPPPTTPPTTPPTVSPGTTYTVQPGDNLFRIALRYNMSYIYLAQHNGIKSPYWVYVGQVIRIPAIP